MGRYQDFIKRLLGIRSQPSETVIEADVEPFPLEEEERDIEIYSDFLADLGDNLEQKRGVVSSFGRILVLAGAGSGKTKVLTKRFIHLVKNKGVPRGKVLAVTFTKEARKEMIRRISKSLDVKPELLMPNIRTFHSFCLSILRQNERFDIVDEKEQREMIAHILSDYRGEQVIMDNLYTYIKDNLLRNFHEKYKTENREPMYKAKPKGFGDLRIKTETGTLVRSKSERDIANFLTSLGVEWKYEKPVEWADKPFKPDFTLSDEVYIEHWCYNDKSIEFPGINKKQYLEIRRWKEEQFQKHRKTLISIEENEMLDLLSLQIRLKEELEKTLKVRLKTNEILELLQLSPQYKKSYEKFVDELVEIINLAKSRLLSAEDVEEKTKDAEKEKVKAFFAVLVPIMKEYEKQLRTKGWGKRDFNDLIKDAVLLLRKDKDRSEYFQRQFEHILVDEFQDVSFGEVELLKLLLTPRSNLFAVGDDWQSIYGWRGSDVNYILEFEKHFGRTEEIILPVNYRSAKTIVEASSDFIQLKGKHHKKKIVSWPSNGDTKIVQVNAKDDFEGGRYVMRIVKTLMNKHPELRPEDFLILKRSSRVGFGYQKVFKEHEFKIPMRTIHWAKGTEFKYVFVLGLKGGLYGFPTIYADKDVKRAIYEYPLCEKEDEERRLMYVAMTRAKRGLFLISEANNESEYCAEIDEKYKTLHPPPK